MPPLPPLKDMLEALQQDVLPGAGGAALVMCVFLLLGRWAAATGSAVAVVVAFAWANFTLVSIGADLLGWDNTSRLLPWKVDETSPGEKRLAHAALVLVVVGLVSRWLGMVLARVLPERFWWGANVLVWLPRVGAIIAVSGWLVRGQAAEAPEWATLRWELAAAMLLIWIVLDGLARSMHSAEVSAHLTVIFLAASVLLLCMPKPSLPELAVLIGFAMFGIAVATRLAERSPNTDTLPDYNPNPDLFDARKPDPPEPVLCASGAIPAAVLFLPGLLIGTRPSFTEIKVPVECCWLVALAPLMLAPFLIPWMNRQNRWLMLAVRVLLILTPLVAAVVMTRQHAQFIYETPPEW